MNEETAKLYAWATARCARSETCRADIRMALARRGIFGEDANDLLDRLEDEGYIDEACYARAFVHDRSRYDRWGRIKIGAALRQKNIASSLINAALQTE
ncbi:MAG: RecX family transcriptional regulator, partial [Alloprevotella sp.]|nr:RecX family transcriptional regulator [Alloprevotella sp.]